MYNPEKVLLLCVCACVCWVCGVPGDCSAWLATKLAVERGWETERQREIWLSVGHFDIFHLFVGILFGFGSCFRVLAARHNRLRLIPPQFSIKPTSRAPPKPCCKATALGSSPPLMLPQFLYTFFCGTHFEYYIFMSSNLKLNLIKADCAAHLLGLPFHTRTHTDVFKYYLSVCMCAKHKDIIQTD